MVENQAKPQQVKITGGEGTPAAYANVCNIVAGPEEVCLQFGQRTPDNPVEALPVSKLCMSLPHAKRMVIALMNTIKEYERIFGEVVADPLERLAPEVRQQLGLDSTEGQEDAR